MNNLTLEQLEFETKVDASDVFDMLPDGVILVDTRGKIQYVNSRTIELFEYEDFELINESIEILLPRNMRHHHAHQRRSYDENPHKKLMGDRKVLQGATKGGALVEVEISLGPVVIADKQFTIAIIRDATVRNRIERLESINKELEHFAYYIAHDLQEPLRTISSFANFINLEKSDELDDTTSSYLGHILKACHRMDNTIKGLLEFSRLDEKRELVPVNFNTILRDLKDDLKVSIADSGAVIEAVKLPIIKADEANMTLLFQNLISNAIKFKNPAVPPIIKISSCRKEDHWLFSFQDNGIGIEDQYHEKIFELCKRLHSKSRYDGSGIGLSHCKKIVESLWRQDLGRIQHWKWQYFLFYTKGKLILCLASDAKKTDLFQLKKLQVR